MPLWQNFLSKTPRKVKTSSVPHQVRSFSPGLKESFHSELSDSIFDEDKLPSSYDGDIIADCWFPDNILPVIPNTKLLIALTRPDGQPLYNSSMKQWDPQYLPLVLQKATPPRGQPRLAPGQEERELSTFMTTIMNALIHHQGRKESEVSSPVDPPATPLSAAHDISPSSTTTSASMTATSDTSRTGSASTSQSTGGLKSEIPPRLWTSSNATQPLSGDFQLKPDSVLV